MQANMEDEQEIQDYQQQHQDYEGADQDYDETNSQQIIHTEKESQPEYLD